MRTEPQGELLFNVLTPLGFMVHCNRTYWQRKVIASHPALEDHVADVIRALWEPEEVRLSRSDRDVYLFYASGEPHIVCAVARRTGIDGFLITAYPADKMKEGETVWTR